MSENDEFYLGVIISLGVIYSMDPDPTATTAQELVKAVGKEGLLRVAIKAQDMNLSKIIETVRSLA